MGIKTVRLLLLLCTLSTANLSVLVGQCCPAGYNPTLSILNLPDSINFSGTLKGCNEIACRYSQVLANHFRDGDFDALNEAFSLFIKEVDAQESINERELAVIHKYGRMIEKIGRVDKAMFLDKYVLNHEGSTPFLETIAKFSLKDFYGVDIGGKDFFDSFDIEMRGFTDSEKLQALLTALYYSSSEDNYELINHYFDFIVNVKPGDPYRAMVLKAAYQVLSYNNDDRTGRIADLQADALVVYNPIFTFWMKMARAENDKNYAQQYELIQKVLELEYGQFESVSDLLGRLIKSGLPVNVSITNFADISLLQTRLGKGLPPVIDAFNIYQAVYQHNLKEKYATLLELVAEENENFDYTPVNILIIGNYLYEQTGDLRYLSEAIETLDGYSGAGALFWVKVREQMRIDGAFEEQLEQIKRLNRNLLEEAGEISLQELHTRMMEVWGIEDALKEKYDHIFTGEYPEADIDLEELRKEMAADSAATVGFYSNGLMLYRLFVSGDTVTVKILNGDMEEILNLSAQLPALLNNPATSTQADEAGFRLYSLLLGDLNAALPPKLHFLSTGPLAGLSFAGLRKTDPQAAPRYLGTDHALSLQFSIGSMRALRDLELQPRFACPLGMAPSFDNNFLMAGELRQAGYSLPPLLYSAEELENLEERSTGRYLYGERASLENYRKYAQNYGVIHLASHAISSQSNGVRSRVFLMDDTGKPAPLYADEVGAETLNADLVVLSACETGGGEEHELEGRVGLTKAYLAAGARSVVSSSWAVDDHATAELMETFYARIADGHGPGKALQTARLTYRENHPGAPIAKWAAFEAYGGMQPVRWEPEADNSFWWYALFGGLAGLAAAFFLPKLYPAKS